MTWTEEEYVAHLRGERRCFARVMRRHGGLSEERAWEAALEAYPYRSSDTQPCRGLVFHDEAWHWAMRTLYGGDCTATRRTEPRIAAQIWDVLRTRRRC